MAIRSPRLRFKVIGRILEEAARSLSAQEALLVLREGEEILVIPRTGRGETVARSPHDPGFRPFLPETRFLPYVAVPHDGPANGQAQARLVTVAGVDHSLRSTPVGTEER